MPVGTLRIDILTNHRSEGQKDVSAHISGSVGEYYGVLNGIAYRINRDADALLRIIPLKPQPVTTRAYPSVAATAAAASSDLGQAPTATAIPMDVAPTPDMLLEQARAERDERKRKLFKREGDEPLRAGHPDMWALLVAGTCLDGSKFQRL